MDPGQHPVPRDHALLRLSSHLMIPSVSPRSYYSQNVLCAEFRTRICPDLNLFWAQTGAMLLNVFRIRIDLSAVPDPKVYVNTVPVRDLGFFQDQTLNNFQMKK